MRIAYLLADPGIGVFGTKGASVHVQEMIRAFRSHGHDVTVYCAKRGNKAGRPETESVPEDLADLRVITVPVDPVGPVDRSTTQNVAEREKAIAQASLQMAQLAAAEDYELIYERYSLFSEAGATLKSLYTERDSDLDHGFIRDVPLVMEVNAPLLQEQLDHRELHDADGARHTTLRALGTADVVSCVSAPVAGWVREILSGQSGEPRVMVIPNGVNTERIRPRQEREVLREDESLESDTAQAASPGADTPVGVRPFTVGFVGTLKPWHGTDVLLRAFASSLHPERSSWRLEFAGAGPEQQRLEELAEELGITQQVIFHGAVAPQDIPAILTRFDVAVSPYPKPEAAGHYFSPLKVYEYLAAGVAVVASAVGELPELLSGDAGNRLGESSERISAGQRGLLVPPGDEDALANALDQLAARPQLRTRLAFAGRAAVVERHTWTRRCGDLLRAVGLSSSTHAGLTTPLPVISPSMLADLADDLPTGVTP